LRAVKQEEGLTMKIFAGAFALLAGLIAGCLGMANTAMGQNAPNIVVTVKNSASQTIGADSVNCLYVNSPCVPYNGMNVSANSQQTYTVYPNNTRPLYNVTYGASFNGTQKSCMYQATNYPKNTDGTCNMTFWAPSAVKTNGTGTSPTCKVVSWSVTPGSCVLNVTYSFAQ
jgi:hypothetical protein